MKFFRELLNDIRSDMGLEPLVEKAEKKSKVPDIIPRVKVPNRNLPHDLSKQKYAPAIKPVKDMVDSDTPGGKPFLSDIRQRSPFPEYPSLEALKKSRANIRLARSDEEVKFAKRYSALVSEALHQLYGSFGSGKELVLDKASAKLGISRSTLSTLTLGRHIAHPGLIDYLNTVYPHKAFENYHLPRLSQKASVVSIRANNSDESIFSQYIGMRLRNARNLAGMSRHYVAQALPISYHSLYGFEISGKRIASENFMNQVSKIIHADPKHITDGYPLPYVDRRQSLYNDHYQYYLLLKEALAKRPLTMEDVLREEKSIPKNKRVDKHWRRQKLRKYNKDNDSVPITIEEKQDLKKDEKERRQEYQRQYAIRQKKLIEQGDPTAIERYHKKLKDNRNRYHARKNAWEAQKAAENEVSTEL